MHTISGIHSGTFQSRGSRFLSFLLPYSAFESFLSKLKEEHRKATHFVYATRIQRAQIIESFSDDGEPKGSSGIPTLNVLRGEDLVDVGLVTVRYFGGTLLGVGGLLRAYTQSAQQAIASMKASQDYFPYERRIQHFLIVPYSLFTQVQYLIERLGIEVCQKSFDAQGVRLLLSSTKEGQDELKKAYSAKFGSYKTC